MTARPRIRMAVDLQPVVGVATRSWGWQSGRWADRRHTRGLDVLVNNAGVTGGMPQEPTTVDLAVGRTAMETNVSGVTRSACFSG
ncbi:hypothetical protein [Micromonospora sp. NPDC005254]|uniref:hypothetical protein n=1 Tax=Micromonospora sp. NPDC005254 TaxID=3364229 RepID=UPI0036CFDE10